MHYDFVEIGTSDFDTEIERCREYDRGLCVEPLLVYLNRLPTKRYVHKVLAAVSNTDGWVDCYYIPEEVIKSHNLPPWLRGCNSIGKPHPTGCQILLNANLDLQTNIKTTRVPMYSIKSLFEMFQVTSLSFLKLDTEGHDCTILHNYLEWVGNGNFKANQVLFESNSLIPSAEVDTIIRKFISVGYRLLYRGEDTCMRYD